MYFQHPTILVLLWLLSGVAGLLVYAQRKRTTAAKQFVGEEMIRRIMPRLGGARPWIKGTLVILGLAAIIVAAARPRFGDYYERVAKRGVDCFVLLDVSRSMLCEDVAPNRLDRAKSDIRDLLRKLVGDRVGLIVFAGKPVLKVPLTTDGAFFRTVLAEVDTYSAARGGTHIGDAIMKALEIMPPRNNNDQMLVLITDGEDEVSQLDEIAKEAAGRRIKIFTVGLGDSTKGARIPIPTHGDAAKPDYVKGRDGKELWSKANQTALKQIALATDGVHIPAGTRTHDLGQVYEDHLAELARGLDAEELTRERYREQFQLFLAIGILLLVIEILIPAHARFPVAIMRKYSENDDISESRGLGMAILVALTILCSSASAGSDDAVQTVGEGIDAFRGGDFKAAAEAFAQADQLLPDDPRIAFDSGCVYAAQGENDKAAEQFRKAAMAADRKLEAMAHYNLGCLAVLDAKARFGKTPEDAMQEVRNEGTEMLQQAIEHFRDCLAVAPEHADARYNLEAVLLWLKHIREAWNEHDREHNRKEMTLIDFLQMLTDQQRSQRANSRELAGMHDSPKRREALRMGALDQRVLAAEIPALKKKIEATLLSPAASRYVTIPSTATPKRTVKTLNRLADEAQRSMAAAADLHFAGKPSESARQQTEAYDKLCQLYIMVAPYQEIVQKAIRAQRALVDEAQRTVGEIDEKSKQKQNLTKQQEPPAEGWEDAAWNQRLVTRYSRTLPTKAQSELEGLRKLAESVAPKPQRSGKRTVSVVDQRHAALQKAMASAIDVAPRVEELTSEAYRLLQSHRLAEALPKQQEALELLELLGFMENSMMKESSEEREVKGKHEKGKMEQEQPRGPMENKPQEGAGQHHQTRIITRQPRDLTRQQAEAVLRRARERLHQRHEAEKSLQEFIYHSDKVDQDW